jgi:hypothetical protein
VPPSVATTPASSDSVDIATLVAGSWGLVGVVLPVVVAGGLAVVETGVDPMEEIAMIFT